MMSNVTGSQGECTPVAPILVGGSPLAGGKVARWGGESRMQPRLVPKDTTARHCQIPGGPFGIKAYLVLNPGPYWHTVENLGPDGVWYAWPVRQGDGCLVFTPHPSYTGGLFRYGHDPRCRTEIMKPEAARSYTFLGGSDDHERRTGGGPG